MAGFEVITEARILWFLQLYTADSTARTEYHVAKGAAVLRQRDFGIGTIVKIIEDRFGDPSLSQPTKVLDIDEGG